MDINFVKHGVVSVAGSLNLRERRAMIEALSQGTSRAPCCAYSPGPSVPIGCRPFLHPTDCTSAWWSLSVTKGGRCGEWMLAFAPGPPPQDGLCCCRAALGCTGWGQAPGHSCVTGGPSPWPLTRSSCGSSSWRHQQASTRLGRCRVPRPVAAPGMG